MIFFDSYFSPFHLPAPCLASYNNILRDNSSCPDADRLVILSRHGRTRRGNSKKRTIGHLFMCPAGSRRHFGFREAEYKATVCVLIQRDLFSSVF